LTNQLETKYNDQLFTITNSHKTEQEELKSSHTKKLKDMENQYFVDINNLNLEFDKKLLAELKDLQSKLTEERMLIVKELKLTYEDQIKQANLEHQEEQRRLQNEINDLTKLYEKMKLNFDLCETDLHESQLTCQKLKDKFEFDKNSLVAQYTVDLKYERDTYERKIQEIIESHRLDLSKLANEFNNERNLLEGKISFLTNEYSNLEMKYRWVNRNSREIRMMYFQFISVWGVVSSAGR
jgi:hypothetical protein